MTDFLAMPLTARSAIILFAIAGLTAAGMVVVAAPPEFGSCLGWILLAALAAHAKVPLVKGSSISLLTAVILMSLMTDGQTAATLAGVCGVTVQAVFPSRKILLHRILYNVGMIVFTVAMAAWVYQWMLQNPPRSLLSATYVACLGASLTYGLVNSACIALIIGLAEKRALHSLWYTMFRRSASSFVLAGVFALGLLEFMRTPAADEMAVLVALLYATYHFSVYITNHADDTC